MSYTYGVLRGKNGKATRLGGKETGIRATLAGSSAAVVVRVYFDAQTGHDAAEIDIVPWYDRRAKVWRGRHRRLYKGPIG